MDFTKDACTEHFAQNQMDNATTSSPFGTWLNALSAITALSAFSSFFIVFIIAKLRKNVTYMLLLHLNLMTGSCDLLAAILSQVGKFLNMDDPLHSKGICVGIEMDGILFLAEGLFYFLLVSDWYLKTYNETRYNKFCGIYNFFVAFVYFISLLLAVFSTQFCFIQQSLAIYVFAVLLNASLIIYVVIMNIVNKIKPKNSVNNNFGLIVANITIILWCPFILVIITEYISDYRFKFLFLWFLTLLGISSPLFTLFYFYIFKGNDIHGLLKNISNCRGRRIADDQTVVIYKKEATAET